MTKATAVALAVGLCALAAASAQAQERTRANSGTLVVDREGRIAVRVRCPREAEGGCAGQVSLRAVWDGRRQLVDRRRVRVRSGGVRTLRLVAPEALRLELEQRGPGMPH